jgi:glycosyltransferase involved in cell wall biosynthesis
MDGIPVSLMEAMGMGVPVVSTRISGIPELITDGEDGRLVSPGDPLGLADMMQQLLGDSAERNRMASAARKTVKDRFSIQHHVHRMLREWGIPDPKPWSERMNQDPENKGGPAVS